MARAWRSSACALAAALALFLLLGAGAAEAQTNNNVLIDKDDSAVPSGLEEGDRFRLLVITRSGYIPKPGHGNNSSDIADHNTAVQDGVAADAGLRPYASKFKALVSTSAVHARDNTGTTGTGVPIYWYKGGKVADDYADFYDGSWDSNVTRNHAGEHLSGHYASAVTGSNNDGTRTSRPARQQGFCIVRVSGK